MPPAAAHGQHGERPPGHHGPLEQGEGPGEDDEVGGMRLLGHEEEEEEEEVEVGGLETTGSGGGGGGRP